MNSRSAIRNKAKGGVSVTGRSVLNPDGGGSILAGSCRPKTDVQGMIFLSCAKQM